MLRRSFLLAAAGILLAACGTGVDGGGSPGFTTSLGRDHALTGRIVATASGSTIRPAALISDLAAADFVLLGEKHDNPDHHALQAWVTEQLLAAGRRVGVAFEMIADDQAPALAAWLAQRPRDPAGLGPAIGWERSGWPAWSIYAPIAGAVLGRTDRITVANLSRARTRAIGTAGLGTLDAATLTRLALDAPLDAAAMEGLTAAVRDGHCGMLPARQIPRMVDVQRARDARMAAGLVEAAAGLDGAVLIAGAEHVRRDRGVPRYLDRLAPGRLVASVAFVEVDPARTDAAQYTGAPAFDYLWFTPRVSDEDHCARMADQLRRPRS